MLDHLPPFAQPERAQLKLYSGGHMFYVADQPRKSFTDDMKAFFGSWQRLLAAATSAGRWDRRPGCRAAE